MALFEDAFVNLFVDAGLGLLLLNWAKDDNFPLGLLLDLLWLLDWLLDLWGHLFLLSGVGLDHFEWAHWLEAWEADALNYLAEVAGWLLAGNWNFVHWLA